MMRTKHRTISPTIQTNFRIPAVTRFVFATFFSETLGGGVPPWTDVGLPCGTLGLFFLTCWKIEWASLLPNPKIPGQKWHHPHLQKNKQGFKQILRTTNSNKTCVYFGCFIKPRKSEAPGLKKRGRRNSRRDNKSLFSFRRGRAM